MYYINKIIGWALSPLGLLFLGLALSWGMRLLSRCFRSYDQKVEVDETGHFNARPVGMTKGERRCLTASRWFLICSCLWIWLWSTPLMSWLVGSSLEREFLVEGKVPTIESIPKAEAIVLLGGGMGGDTNICEYAEMWTSADRVWQAARLYKAGKAPKIYASGGHVEMTTSGLLQDLGVPREAIVFLEDPRNTEEEAKAAAGRDEKKVLLVTSAWHMKRAKLMFEKYAPEVEAIPAPADWEATYKGARMDWWSVLLPRSENLMWNEVWFHEWLGIIGYKWLR